jgi:hypothetical protein
MSNIGPLTTAFAAPSDCSILSVNLVGSPAPTSTTFYNYAGIVWPDPLRCFPSGYPNAYSARFSNFYSPGVCPSGWTAFGATSNFPDPAETTAMCCPPGFSVLGNVLDVYGTSSPCFTTHIASTPATALVISGTIDIATKPYGDNTAGLITSTNFVMQPTGWFVYGVQIRYRAADFIPNNHTLANSTSTSPNTATATQSPTATNNDNSMLSNGAKIGIGVGVPLIVIILGTIIAFILIRHKRRRTGQPFQANRDSYIEHKAELPGNTPGKSGGGRCPGKAELDNTVWPVELEDPTTGAPLPNIHSSSAEPDAISSIQGTPRSYIASETVQPGEITPSDASPADNQRLTTVEGLFLPAPNTEGDAIEPEQVKYRRLNENAKMRRK